MESSHDNVMASVLPCRELDRGVPSSRQSTHSQSTRDSADVEIRSCAHDYFDLSQLTSGDAVVDEVGNDPNIRNSTTGLATGPDTGDLDSRLLQSLTHFLSSEGESACGGARLNIPNANTGVAVEVLGDRQAKEVNLTHSSQIQGCAPWTVRYVPDH